MKLRTIWMVYFSATGTTKKVVQLLGHTLAQQLQLPLQEHCFNLPRHRQEMLKFSPQDLLLLALPVYAGRIPNLLLPYLQSNIRGHHTPAIPLVLYGHRNYDDALLELCQLLLRGGCFPIAGGAFVGEHAFSSTLGAGRPNAQDLDCVEQLAQGISHQLQHHSALPPFPVPVPGHWPLRPYYVPRDASGTPISDFLRAKPVTRLQQCTHCGFCAACCPMGSIPPEQVDQVVGKCIKCCACVKGCPEGAKFFDHPGYLYHKQELERCFGQKPALSQIFFSPAYLLPRSSASDQPLSPPEISSSPASGLE